MTNYLQPDSLCRNFHSGGKPMPCLDQVTTESFAWALYDFQDFLSTWEKSPTTAPVMNSSDLRTWYQEHFWLPDEAFGPIGIPCVLAMVSHLGGVLVKRFGLLYYLTFFSREQINEAFDAWCGSLDCCPEPVAFPDVDWVPEAVVDEGSSGSLAMPSDEFDWGIIDF